jgi:hypothetical protein
MLNGAEMDCATACWFKHNILNPAYDLGFLDGEGGQNQQESIASNLTNDPHANL